MPDYVLIRPQGRGNTRTYHLPSEGDPTRYGHHRRVNYATYYVDGAGYPRWQSKHRSESGRVTENYHVHRLLAIAEFGAEAVKNMDVHHKNDIPWDNRPENIELMEHGEHRSHHAKMVPDPGREEIRKKYETTDVSQAELAEEWGVTPSAVWHIIHEGRG